MNNYSRGDWKVGKGWGVVVTDNGEGFPPNSGHDATDYYGGYLIAESIAKNADAKLIAAAPDLLKALQAIEHHWASGNFSRNPELWEPMKAAISKATK